MKNNDFKLKKNIIVQGKQIPQGIVRISGAKNSALKLLAASLLTEEDIELYNFPAAILDVKIHLEMLNTLGKYITIDNSYVKIGGKTDQIKTDLEWNNRSIRSTLLVLGALTTRFGKGRVPLPGGCNLGDRKYDLHVMILERMGAKVWEEENYLCADVKERLAGTDIHLPIRSTGATENGIIAGTLARGTTTIWNPHIRPEILDLISMLRKMGAKIKVFGQKCIEITGVERLQGARHTVVPDNVEAITWAIASVITNGDIEIENFPFRHLEIPLVFLRESGMKAYRGENSLIVRGGQPFPVEISTGPYPGINSDMQPLFAVYGACSEGESKIVDLRFPGRYAYAHELGKMGMKFTEDGDLLKISGGNPLHGATVKALDLRAGIALLLAGLTAEGTTVIENAWQIERGYENLGGKLAQLGVHDFEITENIVNALH